MPIEAKTTDEELSGLVDEYDRAVAPYTVHRSNTNKLYLAFRSIAAGFSKIRDVVLSLKYRFDARYASEDDLESAMFITGELAIPGKSSIVRIIVNNTDLEDDALLKTGLYVFASAGGELFKFDLQEDIKFSVGAFAVLLFASDSIGAYPVQDMETVKVDRQDGAQIDARLSWSAVDNAGSLGSPPESMDSIRQRLLNDTRRQDSLRELETAINSLPSVFACNLIFNPSGDENVVAENGVELPPKTLLIILTGVPTTELAELVLSRTVYKTYMNTSTDVIWYDNPLFHGGRYPVYFMNHARRPFYLTVYYKFDREKQRKEAVEAAFSAILNKYRSMVQHIDAITEPLLYQDLQDHNIPGVQLKKVYIQEVQGGEAKSVVQIEIPRLMLPELVNVTFVGESDT